MNTCETCRYWDLRKKWFVFDHGSQEMEVGTCRINPPSYGKDPFPMVDSTEWCGQWTAKPTPTPMPEIQPIPSQCQHEWGPPGRTRPRCLLCGDPWPL